MVALWLGGASPSNKGGLISTPPGAVGSETMATLAALGGRRKPPHAEKDPAAGTRVGFRGSQRRACRRKAGGGGEREDRGSGKAELREKGRNWVKYSQREEGSRSTAA